jgi:2-keto-4-pentenoate hydratase/2-oxohepta-3-ene-1,7-dioic acid hydratase in catechol pathway
MRLVTFEYGNGSRVGAVVGERIVDLTAHGLAPDMLTFIRGGQKILAEAKRVVEAHTEGPLLADVRLLAPVPHPDRNIYCVGLNYVAHNDEFNRHQGDAKPMPKDPIIFSKSPNTVIGPGATVERHATVTSQVDYEAELLVIIGRRGRDISREDAWSYVYGYSVINDITARDLQKKHQQWLIGKGLDTHCPMGPCIVTSDEVPAPPEMAIWSKVNGEVRQQANTRELAFDIPALIATLSAGHTLEPGDLIATGTCQGVGIGFDPPRFLQSGDVVEVGVDGIGVLVNPVK